LPYDGPTGQEVRSSAEVSLEDPGRLSYALVKLSPLVLAAMQTEVQRPLLFSRFAQVARPAEATVTRSDTIFVTIFEAAPGGLFVPSESTARPGNFVQIPPQELDRDGDIVVPYGGRVHALGRSPSEIEADIVARLKQRAIEPQAIVTIGERTANSISVLGDVKAPTNIPLRPGGIKLLAAVARAGGSSAPDFASIVTVQRRGRTEQGLLTSILNDPRQNIELAAGDVVSVTNEPRVFMAFGATTNPGSAIQITAGAVAINTGRRFTIDRENISLAEAIAIAGGVLAASADSRSVFLFRYMPREILSEGGIDVSAFPAHNVPTVFLVDLSQAEGYFLANHLLMKHNDIIYIPESPSTDLSKFLTILRQGSSAFPVSVSYQVGPSLR
jgi:polysaccharide biosynthesis/export protein